MGARRSSGAVCFGCFDLAPWRLECFSYRLVVSCYLSTFCHQSKNIYRFRTLYSPPPLNSKRLPPSVKFFALENFFFRFSGGSLPGFFFLPPPDDPWVIWPVTQAFWHGGPFFWVTFWVIFWVTFSGHFFASLFWATFRGHFFGLLFGVTLWNSFCGCFFNYERFIVRHLKPQMIFYNCKYS
jgi:hypothetical protein